MPYVNFEQPEDADKAIVILALRRALRPKNATGAFVTGWGANRDDHPIFTDICNKWARKEPIDKDMLFQARYRAKKYSRQVQETDMWQNKLNHTALMGMLTAHVPTPDLVLEAEIAEAIKEAAGYGGW